MVPGTAFSLQHAVLIVWPWGPHFSIPITGRTTPTQLLLSFQTSFFMISTKLFFPSNAFMIHSPHFVTDFSYTVNGSVHNFTANFTENAQIQS